MKPVPMNSDQTARIGGRKAPAAPISVHTISPARGMARPRRRAYSARCSSSERRSCCLGSDMDSPVHWECREGDKTGQSLLGVSATSIVNLFWLQPNAEPPADQRMLASGSLFRYGRCRHLRVVPPATGD